MRAFKTFSARRINELRRTPGEPVWQRNCYEHIIRSEEKMQKIREYIAANPGQWEFDLENPMVFSNLEKRNKGLDTKQNFQELSTKQKPWRRGYPARTILMRFEL